MVKWIIVNGSLGGIHHMSNCRSLSEWFGLTGVLVVVVVVIAISVIRLKRRTMFVETAMSDKDLFRKEHHYGAFASSTSKNSTYRVHNHVVARFRQFDSLFYTIQ